MTNGKMADGVMEVWKKFRRASNMHTAMILKMNADDETVEMDGEVIEMSPEDLAEEMSESQPRWILWSFQVKRDDGRTQYPLLLVFFSPQSCNQRSKMLYSSGTTFVSEALGITKAHPLLAPSLSDYLVSGMWVTTFVSEALGITKVHPLHELDDLTSEKLHEFFVSSVTR